MRKTANGSASTCKPSILSARPSRGLIAIALMATGGMATPVFAADPDVNDPSVQLAQAASSASKVSPSAQTGVNQPTSPVAGPGTGGAAISTYTNPPPPAPGQNPFAEADQLKLRGWIVPIPGAANTVDQGLFGLRDDLAKYGISWVGFAEATFQDNLLRHELPAANSLGPHSRDNQDYNGQLPSYEDITALFINYDLRRYGIPDGQITVGGDIIGTNWQPGGPNGVGISTATYYQTAFNRTVEVKLGYISNVTEFLGTQVGGNLASGVFGVSAAVGPENGENVPGFVTPGIDVKLNLPDHFYTKVGVQRATDPAGIADERLENPSSVRFAVPGAGVFFIDETGYRVNASPGVLATWIRGAASYTTSEYPAAAGLLTGSKEKSTNFGLYFLADRQLIQPAPHAAPGSAIGGIYGGFSVMYGPSNVNLFSQYYEARLYGFGVVPHRPFDVVSIVWNKNVFSGYTVRAIRDVGLLAHNSADTATIAYSAHVISGVSLNLGVSFIDHPTVPPIYDTHTGSDFNVLANLFIWL